MHIQPEQEQQLGDDFVECAKEYPCTIEQGLLKLQLSKDIELLHQLLHAVSPVKAEVECVGLRRIAPTSICLRNDLKILRTDQKEKNLLNSICIE